MRSVDCLKGLSAKFVVIITEEEVSLTVNDNVLDELLEYEGVRVVTMEDTDLAQLLCSLENIKVRYNRTTFRCSKIVR